MQKTEEEILAVIKDLEQYYTHVETCLICNNPYGYDKKDFGRKSVCPKCSKKYGK